MVIESLPPDGRYLVLTGAGVSVASGVPTFTGTGGLYDNKDVMRNATPEGFAEDPHRVWSWYAQRIVQLRTLQPNAAHHTLATLAQRARALTLITSNVDDLHERAGSTDLHKLHGHIMRMRCTGCGQRQPVPDEVPEPPMCDCGAMFRPDVVWFGEQPNMAAFDAIERAVPVDFFLEVGTSGVVSYGITEAAADAGIPTIRINPEPEPYPGVVTIAEPAEVALPRLFGF